MRASRFFLSLFLFVAPAILSHPLLAQTGCRTENCASPDAPLECSSRAAPRTHRVLMEGDGFAVPFRFTPSAPKIEPGECVEWFPASLTHNSSGSSCPDSGTTCSAPPPPPPCEWETGNASAGTPSVTCHYSEVSFPSGGSTGFYCRIHATPSTGTMRGNLRITTPISLSVDKDTAAGDVLLEWTGGGVAGDETFLVLISDADPRFQSPVSTDPTDGTTGRKYRDPGQLSQPGNRFYLTRNRQANE